eukprot:TRINITY_DN6824_c0_g1_i1.p1 TRINITY_DN6824_c0_g1~~TRINITY_DN6824_c0_g1_i1.p1  ORF type:complete len:581 (+),score=112.56 TRINITY_DN6824_c0_g1_i1:110-1852(+)
MLETRNLPAKAEDGGDDYISAGTIGGGHALAGTSCGSSAGCAGEAALSGFFLGDLLVGDDVEIHSLQGAKELNGRRGRIVTYVEETMRFGVRLEGTTDEKDVKAVKPGNLRRVEGGPFSADLADKASVSPTATAAKKAAASPGGGVGTPSLLQPSPPPREQRHPSPSRSKVPLQPSKESRQARSASAYQPQPPQLPERPAPLMNERVEFLDEQENPDPTRAYQSAKVVAGAFVFGVAVSQAEFCPAYVFVWSFLAVHLVGVICPVDYGGDGALLLWCAVLGLHSGIAAGELVLWLLNQDGSDSLGPWSIIMILASFLYLHCFWAECITLPPDYITTFSLFFPMYLAFDAAFAFSSVELFVEWRYFPGYKLWPSIIFCGVVLMVIGQSLICSSCWTARRNFWASFQNGPEDEEIAEEFVGLEIPDRRVVQEGVYRWERHPAYLGVMLWGVGAEIVLCNPVMLLIVSFVLWATLLYVTLEEEQKLYEEFKGDYANYAALTGCWIPFFNSFLENDAFHREMSTLDNADDPNENPEEEQGEEGEEEEGEDDSVQSEDDLLPTWKGVPRGGALWNRQFREPWDFG